MTLQDADLEPLFNDDKAMERLLADVLAGPETQEPAVEPGNRR